MESQRKKIGESILIMKSCHEQINWAFFRIRSEQELLGSESPEFKYLEYSLRSAMIIRMEVFLNEYHQLKNFENKYTHDPASRRKVEAIRKVTDPAVEELKKRWPNLKEARNRFYAHGFRNKAGVFVANDPEELKTVSFSPIGLYEWGHIAYRLYVVSEMFRLMFPDHYEKVWESVTKAEIEVKNKRRNTKNKDIMKLDQLVEILVKKMEEDSLFTQEYKDQVFRSFNNYSIGID